MIERRTKSQISVTNLAMVIPFITLWFFLYLIMLAPHFIKNKLEFQIKEDMSALNYDLLLLDILRFPSHDGNLADLISASYLNNNYEQLSNEIDAIFKKHIHRDVGWELFIERKLVKDNLGIFHQSKKQSYETILPLITQEKNLNIIVGLNIYIPD